MSFKLSYSNFELLASYVEKKAKGADLKFALTPNSNLEVKLTNLQDEEVVITLFEERESGTPFPKIAVIRRLGDEIK
jgi:hypothetical protein